MTEREAAVLTNAQREFIRGEKDYTGKVKNQVTRRIRGRLYNAMIDLSLVAREFPVEEIDAALESPPPGTPEPPETAHAQAAMSDFFALKYLVHRDVEQEGPQPDGARFALDAENGIELAVTDRLGIDADVSVDAEVTRRGPLDTLAEETEDYADLTLDQLDALRHNGHIEPEQYVEAFTKKKQRDDFDD
jgi:hypothetical protein